MTIALYIFFGTCILTLLGWLFIPRINRNIAAKQEHADRRRAFLAFMHQWRSEVALFQQTVSGITVVQAVYQSTLPRFHAEVAQAQDAFTDRTRFEQLAGKLAGLGAADWKDHSKTEKDIILEAMDELIRFAA